MSIMDVSRTRTFCSATARSLAGLRSAMTTRKKSGTLAAVSRRTGEPHAQEREASATINPGEPVWPASSGLLLRHVVHFSLLHKHSYRKDFRASEDSEVQGERLLPGHRAKQDHEAPEEKPDQDQARRSKEPCSSAAFACSQGPSAFVSGGITTHWQDGHAECVG